MNSKEIAPFPRKAQTRAFVIYKALDNLGGKASFSALHKETLRIWKDHLTLAKPHNKPLFKTMIQGSCISPGYFTAGKRSVPVKTYSFATYEDYARKASQAALARSMYSYQRIEDGKLNASATTIEKIERIINNPKSELPPPRKVPSTAENTEKVLKKAAATMERIEKLDPDKATNMDELQRNLEKLLERQGSTVHRPSTKLEIGIWPAIAGAVIITGLLVAAITAMAFGGA
mgnify:FL=1